MISAQKEKITTLRSIAIGLVSFGLTSVLIVAAGAQGSALFG